jgi:hypothetical protein
VRRRLGPPAVWLLGGVLLVAAGVVALIEAHSHRPAPYLKLAKEFGGSHILGILTLRSPGTEWSQTKYDVFHVAGTALVVAGGLLMIAALIALARRASAAKP